MKPRLFVDVVVTDRRGRPVTDLDREDFRLLVDGQEQAITFFSAPIALPTTGGHLWQLIEALTGLPGRTRSPPIFPPGSRLGQSRRVVLLLSDGVDSASALTMADVLGYYPSNRRDDSARHTVKVKVPGSGFKVRTRKGYIDF